MKNWIAVLGLIAASGLGTAQAATTYNAKDDFIPGPDPQSFDSVWQYFEASFDRTTMTLMEEWRTTGNDVLPFPADETMPQWDNKLGNGQYPFVQKVPPGGPYTGNYSAPIPFPGDSLYIHPAPGTEAPGVAVGWLNNTGARLIVSYTVTFTLIEIAPGFNDTGVNYYVQRQTVGDIDFLALADGFLESADPTVTQTVENIELFPGQFLYFGVDNRGTYDWDHTTLDLVITANSPDSAARIVTHPKSVATVPGTDVTLSVTADGLQPLTYQWLKNEVNIPGATASTLVLSKVSQQDAANYRVVVSNSLGSAPSDVAKVSVALVPTVTLQLNPGIVVVGTVGFHHRVEYREALEPPTTWHLLQDIPLLPSSPYLVYDPTPTSATNKRFYQAVLVP